MPTEPHPAEVPAPPPNYLWRVVYTYGGFGMCTCVWRAVFHPTEGGRDVATPDPNYAPPGRVPADVKGWGTVSQLPGRSSVCMPLPIVDENGTSWTSGPVPLNHDLTLPKTDTYKTDNPYPGGYN